jgi:hypothetical protein
MLEQHRAHLRIGGRALVRLVLMKAQAADEMRG